jgi:hypothetical protein
MQGQRYLVTRLSDVDYIVSDSQDQEQKLYSLMIRPVRHKWYSHQIILASFDATRSGNEYVVFERQIWSAHGYYDSYGITRLGSRILNSLDLDEVDIEHPYELTWHFGGAVTPTL